MSKRKDILHITIREPENGESLIDSAVGKELERDYHVLFTIGPSVSIKLLSARRMKRADYMAAINAARMTLKQCANEQGDSDN
jgi:hypothetical protein